MMTNGLNIDSLKNCEKTAEKCEALTLPVTGVIFKRPLGEAAL
jgi:hypothetical protein